MNEWLTPEFGRTSITRRPLARWKNMKSLFSVKGCGMRALISSLSGTDFSTKK